MTGIPTSPDAIVGAGQSLLTSIWNMLINTIWNVVSSALSPLSFLGKVGLLLGISTLTLIGIQSYRQGYEGRITQPTALMGFVSTFLVIADFIPPQILKTIIAFVAIGGLVSLYNLKSYFSGDTESIDWYNAYRRFFGSLTLALILFILILRYVVGLDIPLLP